MIWLRFKTRLCSFLMTLGRLRVKKGRLMGMNLTRNEWRSGGVGISIGKVLGNFVGLELAFLHHI